MYNKKNLSFENHYLNMIDSLEVNLLARRQQHAVIPVKYKSIQHQNDWLQCGERVDKSMAQLNNNRRIVNEQVEVLNHFGLLSKPVQSLVDRFQTLGQLLEEPSGNSSHQTLFQEYQQLADHIMPTLARIHQRVEARREAVGIHSVENRSQPAADETLDVALRAALKRRA